MKSWLNVNLDLVIKIISPFLIFLGCFLLGVIFEKRVITKLKKVTQKNSMEV